MKRRSLLKSAAWCAAASVLAPLATQARAARVALVTESLAPGVLWIRGAGANVLVVRDARGLCFLDGGLAANAPAVLALARRELGAKDAHTLINTHWHPEHTGLNETLGKSGARIIAHENTRLWLGTAIEQPAGKPIGPLSPKARPNSTTYTEGEIAVGDEVVRYGYLPQAHTDGDLYVHLRRANVLFTGGVVAGKGWSTVDYFTGGWINGMVGGYRSLTQLCTAETRIVTAQGERLMSRQQLDEERTLLARLSDQLGKMLRSGYGPADVLAAAPAKELEARYGDSTEFLTQSFKSLWGHMAPDA